MRLTKNELIKLLQAVENIKVECPKVSWGSLIIRTGWKTNSEIFYAIDPVIKAECVFNDSKIMNLFSEILDDEAKVYFLNSEFFKRLYK